MQLQKLYNFAVDYIASYIFVMHAVCQYLAITALYELATYNIMIAIAIN